MVDLSSAPRLNYMAYPAGSGIHLPLNELEAIMFYTCPNY